MVVLIAMRKANCSWIDYDHGNKRKQSQMRGWKPQWKERKKGNRKKQGEENWKLVKKGEKNYDGRIWDKREGNKDLFQLVTIAFLNGPLGRMRHSFARIAHSAHRLRSSYGSASLTYFDHRLAHSFHSLPRTTLEIPENVFTLKTCSSGTIAFFVVTRNTP